MFDAARASARASAARLARRDLPRPLEGSPVTSNNLAFTEGVRTEAGAWIRAERVPDVDAPFGERLHDEGAAAIGETTVPAFGWMGCGESPLTGTTHNPWKLGANAGGSRSGAGDAAAGQRLERAHRPDDPDRGGCRVDDPDPRRPKRPRPGASRRRSRE